uniref:Uncharacterized protein n=1 Tax=Chenopodium quinoa TaxID=63459 RepID=A0A803N0V3_CHEQI
MAGAPGYVTSTMLNGCSFVEGWEQNFFISKWSMHQLLIECPSIYELMACPNFHWQNPPCLELWREKHDDDGNFHIRLESYTPEESITIFEKSLSSNTVDYVGGSMPLPFNLDILSWANETREILSRARVPPKVKFYNIYGTSLQTPHSVCYGSENSPVTDLEELRYYQAKFTSVEGDGTVPTESAKADGLNAEARVGVPGEHRGILSDHHVFRILKHWLNAGEPDPFYDPLNDYVILPTEFEIERVMETCLHVTTLQEEWEIIRKDSDMIDDSVDANEHPINIISVSEVAVSLCNDKAHVADHPYN